MEKVYIVAAQRTPIGKFNGQLASKSAVELGAIAIKAAVEKAKLSGNEIDQVLMGNVIQAGTGQNPARQASMVAGLGEQVPAITINDVCASGMSSVDLAASLIRAGQANVIVAGGMESMSQAPYVLPKARNGYRFGNGTLLDAMQSDALNDVYGDYPMGITAENINDKYQITRHQQDEFALTSHQRAVKAQKAGYFDSEIVPVEVKQKRTTVTVTVDEAPRPATSLAALEKLKPAFKPDGSVTAGNASGINDGGAALVLASESAVNQLGLTPLAEWQGAAIVGLDPALMGLGPYYAIKKLLKNQQMSSDDVDTYEINEAFAAQALVCQDLLHLDPSAVNPWGGAIALGHPVGCSGARIIVTMINEMHRDNHERGIASLCVGGGMGEAVLLKKI
ncbi:acetyl-CoA C-acetyltransferase [Limosilactobacillus reuteri]|uniref:thiolase family protein n=1 Tax=Limosilactobacillus reuteri TaxID=1598 RepID=UPI001E4858A5|nr:acetyl-CoA C-acetyltransferase [Limosilactobacillus reuteri]MCC4326620.1 acetyl-CoA C-acetyltransferase [Limosilactobacillus reuteri]MCC4330591.1 acetyl-CoA C-acetyltransferase [Limosilactobacillus reuteri]MCC4353004.1 acetyl-CoA C-acetyltransferase [Limosilactobacillus reuteri]MCC4377568.1 acetyl-CoA C-acetyltransferase [Limosilactobacillus reuteri]